MLIDRVGTRDADEAVDVLGRFFPDFTMQGRGTTVEARVEAHAVGGISLIDYQVSGPEIVVSTESLGFAAAQVSGDPTVSSARERIRTDRPFALPVRSEATFGRIHGRAVQLDAALLQRLIGRDAEPAVRLATVGAEAISHEAGRVWAATVRFVLDRMRDGSADDPLIADSLERMLASAYLRTFPTTWPEFADDRPAGGGTSRSVRRAVRFIDEHLREPIGVAEIAAAAGLSIRGVQAAFRRELDSTPAHYLRAARLDGARRDILTGDPGDSVAAIARRWGFAHLGRFALHYREQYGETPSRSRRT